MTRPMTAACCRYNQSRKARCVKSVAVGPSLANRLRLGGFTKDGLSYKGLFVVRSYEVGVNKTISIQTIANFLQEISCNHYQLAGFSSDGLGTTPIMRKLSRIWVAKRMHIEVYKYPSWGDVVEIEWWFHLEVIYGSRAFIIKDYATGEIIGKATGKWVQMNHETRRLQKITDEVQDISSKTLGLAPSEENNDIMKKIAKLDDPTRYNKLWIAPKPSDLDMNQHINHVSHIGWIIESMPQKVIESHELEAITLDFKRECQKDDLVDSLTSPEFIVNDTNSTAKDENDYPQFLHLLKLSKEANEISRARTVWREKPAKK